jgi:hypothetical protein
MRNEQDMLYNAAAQGGFGAARDYRVPQQRPEKRAEPNMLRMGLIAAGIAVLALASMSLWSWAGHKHGSVPVIEADSRPVREKPVDQGGMKVEGANEAILSGNTDSKAVVAPAPETPALAALRGAASAPPSAPAPAPAPAIETANAPSPAPATPEEKIRVSKLVETPMRPLLNASPPPVAVPPATPNSQPKQANASALGALPAPSVPRGASVKASIRTTPTDAVPSGAAMVQLAALRSESAANVEWQRLEKKFPALLGGREPSIAHTEHDGKSFWRLRVSGFADRKSAGEFCSKLKSSGGQCTLAAG